MEQGVDSNISVKLGVVIVAAGSGSRMGSSTPKQFQFLGQLPVLAHSINQFAVTYPSCEIVVVLSKEHIDYWGNLAGRFSIAPHTTVEGGCQRFHSSKAGIEALSQSVDVIAIHDGARPLVSSELIRRATQQAASDGSAIPAIELFDSIRTLSQEDNSSYYDRAKLRAVQTPQIFDAITLRRAYRQEFTEKFTDDATVVEAMGERVFLCQGERGNIKITTPLDMKYAELLIEEQIN
ncbi:MAG: 2-C-methyl-D-erythritol 4-phosphate cytidylyltransferase [Rikenellaceae bacterium]